MSVLGTGYGAGNQLTPGGAMLVPGVRSDVVGLAVVVVGSIVAGVGLAVVVVGATVGGLAVVVGGSTVGGLAVVVGGSTGSGLVVVVGATGSGLAVVVVRSTVGGLAVVVVGSTVGGLAVVVVGSTGTWSTTVPEGSTGPSGYVTLPDTGTDAVVGDGSGATSTKAESTRAESTWSRSTATGSGGFWSDGAHADAANTRTSPAPIAAATLRGIRKQLKTDITTTPYRNTATDMETPSQTIVDVNFEQSRTSVRSLHTTINAWPNITARGGGRQNSTAAICDTPKQATATQIQRRRRLLRASPGGFGMFRMRGRPRQNAA